MKHKMCKKQLQTTCYECNKSFSHHWHLKRHIHAVHTVSVNQVEPDTSDEDLGLASFVSFIPQPSIDDSNFNDICNSANEDM